MSAAAQGLSEKRLLLLVDDDVLILGLLGKFLQQAGYDVRLATSGQMALDMLGDSGREPDLALLDINMPGMSGLALAEHLKSGSGIAFMFLSANDDPGVVRAAADAGAVGFLVKPINTAQIVPSVQAALARADEIRGLRGSESRLVQALQEGRETGMAVGVLMERYKSDRETAFRVLRGYARAKQRKLNDVAVDMLAATEALNQFMERFNGSAPSKKEK